MLHRRPPAGRVLALAAFVTSAAPPARASSPEPLAPTVDRAQVIAAVLAAAPELAGEEAAIHAASARVRMRAALPEPMLTYELAPLTALGGHRTGQSVTITQPVRWPGRVAGPEAIARAEVEAAVGRRLAMANDLALMAARAFEMLSAADANLRLTREHERLVSQQVDSARAQYGTASAMAGELYTAEMELAEIRGELVMFAAERDLAAAEINVLMGRAPDAAIAAVVDRRLPELAPGETEIVSPAERTAQARMAAATHAEHLARRAAFPDLEVMGRYDTMWEMPEGRWMVGVGVELPLWQDSRAAEGDEARAMGSMARAEADQERRTTALRGYQLMRRSAATRERLQLLEGPRLSAARGELDATSSAYGANAGPLAPWLRAERTLLRIARERIDLVTALFLDEAEWLALRGELATSTAETVP